MQYEIHNSTLRLLEADLTEMEVDAIVNAANEMLQLGGGVAGAIRSKGGPQIQQECDQIGHMPVGTAALTTGGTLKAKYVIHAVGPRMGEGEEDRKLRDATLNSLKLADKHQLNSLALPAVSTGIFGFPLERCAQVMLAATVGYLRGKTGLQTVVFCLWGNQAFQSFAQTLRLMFEGEGD